MFIIRFFTGSVVGALTGMVVLAFVVVVVLGGVTLGLAATGSPGVCEPGGGPITLSDGASDAFKLKWTAFDASLAGGAPASVSFDESELSSRATSYLDDHDAPFDDVRVCVHDGYGEGSSTISLGGLDVDVKLKGTLDLDGAHPEANIDNIEIGNAPGWLASPLERLVNRALDDQLDDIDLNHRYTPALAEGRATVDGEP
jgi:hypothetical protein